ncbi:phosphopantetheine binding protein [Murinocardiopsis flavida]|uniref:Phosphopantetheine binding protein n=1 Tax=Murinocardiopsis flavida TaxID=645275 RepID=A0A2P8C867_9ACTN|nr:acyl carrier protein [Murinocardiopsis flavida]PSK81160.1 phosphopantetheine binding protein [Murinocardiopsis flavida]
MLDWDDSFESTVRQYLPLFSAEEEIREDTNLLDAGLDSMGIVELLAKIEADYGVRFQDDALTLETFQTAGSLWRTLSALR